MYAPSVIADFFLEKASQEARALTPMQLIKLVYIAHGWHLGYFGQPLISEPVQAWKFGPVIRSLYNQLKRFGSGAVMGKLAPFASAFGGIDQRVQPLLENVWNAYKNYSGLQLSTLTHQPGTPWYVTWHERGGSRTMGAMISNEDIRQHYRQRISA